MTTKSKHLELMVSGLRLCPPQFQTISLIEGFKRYSDFKGHKTRGTLTGGGRFG